MESNLIRVPATLLLDPRLTSSTKLVWMLWRLLATHNQAGPTLLSAYSGLSRPTVRSAWVQLEAKGWACTNGASLDAKKKTQGGLDARVAVPGDLLMDRRVSSLGRILYGALQLTPGFQGGAGSFTYVDLGHLLQTRLGTVRPAVHNLVETGWLSITQRSRLLPIFFSLTNPVGLLGEAEVAAARKRLGQAAFRGEALMREYLNLVVDSDNFEDNARPGFLVNPYTQERMELDRFYTPRVAFAFNGSQHYGPTGKFTEEQAREQRARDYMKLGICVTRGIDLQIVHAEDLSLEGMKALVGDRLPWRNLSGHQRLIEFLESMSRRYRMVAKRYEQTFQDRPLLVPRPR